MYDPSEPRAKVWHVPQIDCSRDHRWVDITTYNDLPDHRYLCAACYAVRTEQPACMDDQR